MVGYDLGIFTIKFGKMKKQKLKLCLNKISISKLQSNKMEKIKGGATYTWDNTCGDRSEYPACGWSGCWGARTCEMDTTDQFFLYPVNL